MKKRIWFVLIIAGFSFTAFSACKGKESKPASETVKAAYKCPMNCSEQVFDKPGKCPECGMDLEKVTQG